MGRWGEDHHSEIVENGISAAMPGSLPNQGVRAAFVWVRDLGCAVMSWSKATNLPGYGVSWGGEACDGTTPGGMRVFYIGALQKN